MLVLTGPEAADRGAGDTAAGARREPGHQRGRQQGPQEGGAGSGRLDVAVGFMQPWTGTVGLDQTPVLRSIGQR